MLDRKPEEYVADYYDYCKDADIDPNVENSITQYINEYSKWHVMFRGINELQSNAADLEKILKEKDKYLLEESKKLVESHLDDYSAEKEYDVTYIDGNGKDKEIKFTPSKNTNIAGIQKELGKKQKDFFKLKDIKECKLTESKKVEEDKEVEERKLTISEKLLLEIIQSVNSEYTLDNVVCQSTPQGNVHLMTRDGKDICTVGREEFTISGDDTILIDELRNNGYWEELDTLDEEVLIEKENCVECGKELSPEDYYYILDDKSYCSDCSKNNGVKEKAFIVHIPEDYVPPKRCEYCGKVTPEEELKQFGACRNCYYDDSVPVDGEVLTEGTDLSVNDNTVIVNKNQYGYNTIAIIIDDTNKRFQLVSGQTLPTGKYKKASKKAIRDKAEILKDKGYTEVRGKFSLAESKETLTEGDYKVSFNGNATVVQGNEEAAKDTLEKVISNVPSSNIKEINVTAKLEEGTTEDIMAGKALSVKDKEILAYIEDRLVDELGRDWRRKSLIDIEEITYNAVDQYADEHNEEDINAGAYYKEIRKLTEGKVTEGKVTTPMGEFEYEELKAIETEMKDAFKDYWAERISAADLEATKQKLGKYLTPAQISNCQYDASREVEKVTEGKEETPDEILDRAIDEEQDAIDTYDELLDGMEDEDIIAVIEEIKKDEEDHKEILQHYDETGEVITDEDLEEKDELDEEVLVESEENNEEESGLTDEQCAIIDFTDELDEVIDNAGFDIVSDHTQDTVRIGIWAGESVMNVVIYSTADESAGYDTTTIGIGGDNVNDTVYPLYVEGWDYETASPENTKPEIGQEVYAMFKPMAEVTPQDILEIAKASFGAKVPEGLEELDEEELLESDEMTYEPVVEYVITFNDLEEEIFDNKTEADDRFEGLKASGDIDRVDQYFMKVWVWEHGGYVEDDVEVFYSK